MSWIVKRNGCVSLIVNKHNKYINGITLYRKWDMSCGVVYQKSVGFYWCKWCMLARYVSLIGIIGFRIWQSGFKCLLCLLFNLVASLCDYDRSILHAPHGRRLHNLGIWNIKQKILRILRFSLLHKHRVSDDD